ncbi:predicted protein [Naegleria gruberi]|uniref:Predicted protein n=1 Tax=Naegleria gruberi TaxID=5762 RepID=D2V294_NAEGR|nr:uncharacterized protein NAEGRDRAFT_46110 [Naegleria gruberi]EFC48860.1 predicted protein [Naegleria gruberi]|eukprot:XP_002681604.1 predicted protein [Naegleria gruberi strain NEG-M]
MSSFVPSTKLARERALDKSTLPPKKIKIYYDEDAFVPLGKQKKGSWLVEHKEVGQTFPSYERGSFNRIKGSKQNVIYICCLEEFPEDQPTRYPSMTILVEFLKKFYWGVEVKLFKDPTGYKTFPTRLNDGVEQYKAPDILKYLKKVIPKDAYCIIAVTMVDLYPRDEWNFVFGFASLEERVGVFSFARYHPDFYGEDHSQSPSDIERNILRRSCKVASHEIGHMFGFKHCIYYKCAMNGSNHMEESDERPLELCPVELRKLQHCIGFDEKERYQQLLTFFKNHPQMFSSEIQWFTERLEYIN